VLARFTATAQDGDTTTYLDYGLAADAGYQALIADKVSLALGGGVEVLATSRSIPNQQFPARLYANGGVLPRFLLSLGWAF
jgi:hypothetical protein